MIERYEECWLCGVPLDEDEPQYCTSCELSMLKSMVGIEQKEN